jgi:hypothetical protein
MTPRIVGFRPPDQTWRDMKAAWDACEKAGVPPPKEVQEFFGNESPDPLGVQVKIDDTSCLRKFRADNTDGYEIDITKLPAGLTIIRVYNV